MIINMSAGSGKQTTPGTKFKFINNVSTATVGISLGSEEMGSQPVTLQAMQTSQVYTGYDWFTVAPAKSTGLNFKTKMQFIDEVMTVTIETW